MIGEVQAVRNHCRQSSASKSVATTATPPDPVWLIEHFPIDINFLHHNDGAGNKV